VHKGIAKCICKNKKVCYTTARENILKRHKSVELNLNLNLGLHNVRSGSASAAARSDVDERCIKKDGQWKSDVSKDGYIADTFVRRDFQYLKALDYHFLNYLPFLCILFYNCPGNSENMHICLFHCFSIAMS
jgi:hypothetical protein